MLDEVEQVSAEAVPLHYSEGFRFDLKDVFRRRAVVDSFARTGPLKTFNVNLRCRKMNGTRVPTSSTSPLFCISPPFIGDATLSFLPLYIYIFCYF